MTSTPETVTSDTPTPTDPQTGGEVGGVAPGGEAALRAELEKAQAEVKRLKDENLRVIAESRNQAQRAQRDRQESLRYAEAEFARELLIVLDDFERTRESAQRATDAKAVIDGVRIVYEHFLKLLKDRHIEPIEAVGKAFDPACHEALLRQPSDHAEGMVIQEVARGYKMHDRVLRPSRVVISAGPASGEKKE